MILLIGRYEYSLDPKTDRRAPNVREALVQEKRRPSF